MKKIVICLLAFLILLPMSVLAEQATNGPANLLTFAENDIYGASLLVLKNTTDDQTKSERIYSILNDYPDDAKASDKTALLTIALQLAHTITDEQARASTLWSIAEYAANNNCVDKAAISKEMATIAHPEANPYIVLSFSRVYQFMGENDEAFKLIDKFTTGYLKQSKDDIDWEIVSSLIEEYSLLGKYEQALAIALKYITEDEQAMLIEQIFMDVAGAGSLDVAIKMIQQLKNKDYIDSAWDNIANGYAKKSDLTNALQAISKIKDGNLKLATWANLGEHYTPTADYDKVIKATSQIDWPYDFVYILAFVPSYYHDGFKEGANALVAEAQRIVDEHKVGANITFAEYLAQAYLAVEDRALAIKTIEQVVLDDPEDSASEFEDYASVFYELYDENEAEIAQLLIPKFLEWAKKVKPDKARVPILTGMADLYWQCEDVENATALYKEALDLAKKVKDSKLILDTYLPAIDYYLQQKQSVIVGELLNGAMEVFKTLKGKYGVDDLLATCINAGDLAKYEEVVQYKEEYSIEEKVDDLINLAQGAEDLGNNQLALEILQSGLKLAGLETEYREQFLSAMAEVYYELSQYEQVKQTLGLIEDEEVKADTISSITYFASEGRERQTVAFCLDLLKVLKDPTWVDYTLVKLVNYAASIKGEFALAFEILPQIKEPLFVSDALATMAENMLWQGVSLDTTMQKNLAEIVKKTAQR